MWRGNQFIPTASHHAIGGDGEKETTREREREIAREVGNIIRQQGSGGDCGTVAVALTGCLLSPPFESRRGKTRAGGSITCSGFF